MNLTDDETLKFQKGSPVFLDDICAIYPPKLGEIVDEGYSNFQKYLSVILIEKPLTVKDPELRKLLANLSDFQYLLSLASADLEINQVLKKAFFFFTHESITFSYNPAQIVVGPLSEKHLLIEEKFYEFQQIIRRMFFLELDDTIVINKNDDPRVKEMKLKMRQSRERVRRAKEKEARKKGNDLKFSDLIGSMTINSCGLNMENIWNITYYAFHDQLKRMGWRDEFNINNRAALAGAKLKQNQLKYWMRSIANAD